MGHNKLENSERDGNTRPPDLPSEKSIQVKKQHLELYKKDLHDPDNHYDMITNLESDILECEVKWALGSITMNKASGGD